MTASGTDTWSPVAISWDFGDGAKAAGAAVSHVYATLGTKTVTVTATDAVGNSSSQTRSISVTPGTGNSSKVKLTIEVPKQNWKQIEKAGAIKLRCKLDLIGSCAASASFAPAVARRLGLKVAKKAKAVTVGKGSAQVSAGQFRVVKVKLRGKARKAIAAATRKVPVAIAVTGSAAGSEPSVASGKLKIKRP
jgi:PKD repeat protein